MFFIVRVDDGSQMSESIVDRAKHWSGRLPQWSEQFEVERKLSEGIAAEFARAGFFRMLVPKVYGGLQVHPLEFIEVLKLLAIGDGSASWNAMIGSTTGLLSASLPEAGAMEIYAADPEVLTVGVTAPAGRADRIEGGFHVTGRWPFGSGSQNAQWISGGCFVYEEGEPVLNSKGQPEVRFMMFPSEQVTIEDTWDVVGLRGTGSHHFGVNEVFVPEHHSVISGVRASIAEPLYQFPLLGLLALGVASVALGTGYRALEEFIQLAVNKQPTGGSRTLAERAAVQSSVARSTADLRSAEALMKEAVVDAWYYAERGERLTEELKSSLRLAAVNGTHSAVAAVDRLYDAAGGSAIYKENVLQRCFRDVHVTTQHIMVGSPIYEVVGRVQLGLPARSML